MLDQTIPLPVWPTILFETILVAGCLWWILVDRTKLAKERKRREQLEQLLSKIQKSSQQNPG